MAAQCFQRLDNRCFGYTAGSQPQQESGAGTSGPAGDDADG
jgi:hypothetical protein